MGAENSKESNVQKGDNNNNKIKKNENKKEDDDDEDEEEEEEEDDEEEDKKKNKLPKKEETNIQKKEIKDKKKEKKSKKEESEDDEEEEEEEDDEDKIKDKNKIEKKEQKEQKAQIEQKEPKKEEVNISKKEVNNKKEEKKSKEEKSEDDEEEEEEEDSEDKGKKDKIQPKKEEINNIQKKEELVKKEEKNSGKEKTEDDDEEDEEDDKDKKINSNNKLKIPQKQNNKEKNKNQRKSKISVKKYFSIDESSSSKSKSDNKSSNKSLNNNKIKTSELSSYIDERFFNTNTSLNFTIQSNNSKNKNSISSESENPNYPKVSTKGYRNSHNKYFGDFNTLDKDFVYKKKTIKEETEEESETDMTLPLKERVYNEFNRHKYYLDTNEKGAYTKINKKSFTNSKRYKYRKSILLHKKAITCLISLSGTIKKIAYASSSLGKEISLWDSYFLNIHKIKCTQWHSNFLSEFDTTNLLSCESNHIKMYDLKSEDYDVIKIFKDHIDDILCLLPVIDFDEEKYIFLSGGKDKTLRLWDHEMDAPIKYYEGHYSTVTHIKKYGNNNKKVISCSEDKTFIVWDIKNTNPLKIFNNYFNHLVIANDSLGFCCGAYDNKIRFYNNEYILIKCIVSQLFGIRNILMINDYCILIVDIDNNINILDLDEDENNLAFIYTGYEDEVVDVIKSFNWNKENQNSRAIMVACKNGYVYLYTFEYDLKSNSAYNNSNKKKHKATNKKNK